MNSFKVLGKNYSALLFDMDGTLIDNMMVHHEAWRVALSERGIHMSIEEVKDQVHGVNHEIMARLFGDTFSTAEAAQFAYDKEAAYRKIYADQIELLPGAERFLESHRSMGVPMALATAAPVENVDFVFKHLPLRQHFPVVKHSGDVSRGKPDPQVFELCAAALGVELRDCLVFEDSVTGAKAAANGGCDAVVITTTHETSEFAGLDNIVAFANNYNELLNAPH